MAQASAVVELNLYETIVEGERKLRSTIWIARRVGERSSGVKKGTKGRASSDENVGGGLKQLPELVNRSSLVDLLLRSFSCIISLVSSR